MRERFDGSEMCARVVCAYLSEHGFGHAVRSVAVLRELTSRHPQVELLLATALPSWILGPLPRAERVPSQALRPPLVQSDGFAVDHQASLALLDAEEASWNAELRRQIEWLTEVRADLVYVDIPPLPVAAAARCGIAAVALGNFTWDWIYRRYEPIDPRYRRAAERAEAALADATRLLALPTFPEEQLDGRSLELPWVARRPTQPRERVRRLLGIEPDSPAVLLSFGGHPSSSVEALASTPWADRVHLLAGRQLAASFPKVHGLDEDALVRSGIEYIDVVAACDVVVTKPGYGILADCLASSTRLVALSRPEFPESPLLLEPTMTALLDAVVVPPSGRSAEGIAAAVDEALRRPRPAPRCALDGADRAVDELARILFD